MRIKHGDHQHEVWLGDDGTLDTVIDVDGIEVRFSGEYASTYRRKDGSMTARGLRELAMEACNDGLDATSEED